MAAMIKKAATAAVNTGPPSSFYAAGKPNPVLQSLDQEINLYVGYMKKRAAPGYKKPNDEASSRPADTLFELWNKFEPRLPMIYYQRKLLEMGDFLASIKEYNLALWQCYGRYLKHFGDVNVEEITDVAEFKSVFFPKGFDTEDAGFTFRAVMGKSICTYQVVRQSDPKLQNAESVSKCVQLLAFLRLVTQVILPKEALCWLIYNGTVHIYSISGHLMTLGHSAKVLEFVLWACMCMESCVPLLAVRYLTWRATLYTAVCQCYYDCKAGHHAESFARRALTKVNELSQLESMSNAPEKKETEAAFRNATVKMAIMVYRRTVFETRRKPKGLLRPKTRANLKDAVQLPWPRTQSEKLLAEMFEGSAAQMLCLLETLSDTNRRTLISAPPAADSEVEILDVYAELFMAAQEIIAGGGGTLGNAPAQQPADLKVPGMGGVVKENSLISMATRGEDGVPLSAVVRVVKLAYCYEQWDVFDTLIDNAIAAIQEVNGPEFGPDVKSLELLKAYDKFTPRTRHRRLFMNEEDSESQEGTVLPPPPMSRQGGASQDDLIHLAEVLLSIVTGPYYQSDVDIDMIVDACLSLWNKCKAVFLRYQTGSMDNPKYLMRMDNPGKWVYILDIVHQVLGWCGLSAVDPALTAEVALRLALVFEASAALEAPNQKTRSGKSMRLDDSLSKQMDEDHSMASQSGKDHHSSRRESNVTASTQDFLQLGASRITLLSGPLQAQDVRSQLVQAREILELGLENVSYARQVVALSDGKNIADVGWAQDLHPDLFKPLHPEELPVVVELTDPTAPTEAGTIDDTEEPTTTLPGPEEQDATAVWNMIRDLHLELIFIYHRVCVKLAALGPDPKSKVPKPFKRRTCSHMTNVSSRNLAGSYIDNSQELMENCRKNQLSKALLCMQRALAISCSGAPSTEQSALLEEARGLIVKCEAEEKKLYLENSIPVLEGSPPPPPSRLPPPPLLLSRTDTSMVFTPAPFTPANGEKVVWYRLFARNASGSNVKVRLNDYYLPGTGEQVPAFRCELRVAGLRPGEKYVFAVAAYTAEGRLIGGSIGDSTKHILASHPLPILLTWAYLAQVSYQVHHFSVAQEACTVLWKHFVAKPPPPQQVTYMTSAQDDFSLTLHRLNSRVVSLSSPVLLRMLLASIFIHVDMNVKNGALFCDTLCDGGPVTSGQLSRLKQCEKMLVALELAGWLNEANLALQAVVQCYGLLAPLIYFKIPSTPVVQVLERCHTILQDIPSHLRTRRAPAMIDSLHHMAACLTYHLAKVLRTWNQRALAASINDNGRKMLTYEVETKVEVRKEETRVEREKEKDTTTGGGRATAIPGTAQSRMGTRMGTRTDEPDDTKSIAQGTGATEIGGEGGSLTLAALKKKKTRKGGLMSGREEGDITGNEELKALEAHMLKLSKQAQGDHELSGSEDPSILHAYIAYLPSKMAYKEVAKFKRRARYLEFFVQVAQKALAEGLAEQALEWCSDTGQWLNKRNEQIIGSKIVVNKQPGVVTIAGDDPKKFAAAVVEYSKDKRMSFAGTVLEERISEKEKQTGSQVGKDGKKVAQSRGVKAKKPKYKAIAVTANMTDVQKQAQEEAELAALQTLCLHLVDMIQANNRRKRFRKICIDELPWRAQLNIIEGLSQFGVFLHRLEFREKMLGNLTNHTYKTSFLDQEWFTFETAGTLVVGWEGGPSRQVTRQENRALNALQQGRASGIEMAAAAATGKPPGALFPIPQEEDDTPRTYRSDIGKKKHDKKGASHKSTEKEEDPESALISANETRELLTKTFAYFTRAIVLAHRGRHWILLQNACRALWNCTHTALLRTHSCGADTLLDVDTLRELSWHAFYMAADCLLDMLLHLQVYSTSTPQPAYLAKEKNRSVPNKKPLRPTSWKCNHGKGSKKSKVPDAKGSGSGIQTWMGQVKAEKGGASLKFETPLDDISVVDMRWVRRVILRVLEMLYYEQRWERLVAIGMRFNAISANRYAEQINPLLVQAQRKLVSRIAVNGGHSPPQPHFQYAMQEFGAEIDAKIFTRLQLRVMVSDDDRSHIGPGAQFDPAGNDLYSGGTHALRLCSVPLDVSHGLQELRQSLSQTAYTARALQHSRRLLVLYLAGQMNVQPESSGSRGDSRVGFAPNTARPQPTMPIDLQNEEFLSMDDVQTSPLPKSQIGVVITSYDKTIELLMANNQKGLAAEAMKELGNLHYHNGNLRSAYKWWCESLDTLLGSVDSIHQWRNQFANAKDISTRLLEQCGLWGCLLGGVLASNIAQYILTSDLGMRMECCFLSGYFFKALFRASLPHPTADRDYAVYDVGEGCEVTYLVPGIDLLSERFRMDGRTLVSALRFLADELARGHHYLFVLPLLSLYQYITTFVCRDLQRSVDGRILRVRILTDLGLYIEAFIVLQRLLNGERLPHSADSHFRQMESRTATSQFDTSKSLMDANNLKVLESVIDKRLSSNLGMLYGPHLTCRLSIAQGHLLITLADTIPVLPKFEDISPPGTTGYVHPHTISTASRKGGQGPHISLPTSSKPAASLKKIPEDPPKSSEEVEADEEEKSPPAKAKKAADDESSAVTRAGKRFSSSKKPVTLETIKGTLLSAADQILSTLAEIILENSQYDKGIENMNPAEVELVIMCKLELSAIARQRHHAALAARIVLGAMKMLQASEIFKPKKDDPQNARQTSAIRREPRSLRDSPIRIVEPESSQFQFQNFQSRSRLDARLWLRCRLALVESLLLEIKGMGDVKGPDRPVNQELGSVRQYCAEGIVEAEACGDVESKAQLLLQGAVVDMQEGVHVAATQQLLQEVLQMLSEVRQLSDSGQLLRVQAMVHLTDLEVTDMPPESADTVPISEVMLPKYCAAQLKILEQLESLGEEIEHYYPSGHKLELSSPVSPLRNLYLPHLLLLVQTKLRIGHAMARNVARRIKEGAEDAAGLWSEPLGVLMTTLELCQVIALRTASIEAEILLSVGKVQRQLFQLGCYSTRIVAQTLLDAITTTYNSSHDLGLMRQAYLELAVLYLISSQRPAHSPLKQDSILESLPSDDDLKSRTESPAKSRRTGSKRSRMKAKETTEQETPQEQERRAAWVAVRCAAAVGQAQRARQLLTGTTAVTTQELPGKAQAEMPEFAVLDLVSSYVLGEKKRIYRTEIEEELAPLTEALEPPVSDTYDGMLGKARDAVNGLSWVQILGYQAILQRISSTATVTAIKKVEGEAEPKAGTLGPDFDLGFISHAQLNVQPNHDTVRYVLFSPGLNLRLMHIHQFLASNLVPYAQDCVAVYPPATLKLPHLSDGPAVELSIICKSYAGNRMNPEDCLRSPSGLDLTQTEPEPTFKPADKPIVSPAESELCLQWYQPSLEDTPHRNVEAMDARVLLLHAFNVKATAKPSAAMVWVSLATLLDLHDRLAVLTQRGEISLADKPKKPETAPPTPATSKGKRERQTRIKALSPKVKRDELLENLLHQCMQDIEKLLNYVPEVPPEQPLAEEATTPGGASQQGPPSIPPEEQPAPPLIPFDVDKSNMHIMEELFDPGFGGCLKEPKMLQWFSRLF